ncbi:HAUS augmin-like complex subunit 6 N-terminus-domain-containing protein [Phycomyces nitens]|nr:HAUS augmin-like complex subunit 6 N-terminus-domain-containing protein [Phycomyces nitens]
MSSVADSFLANLKLLGFDPQVYATGIFFNIRFANDMFTRNADNNKAFEITSHFLFSKLDPVQTKKTFRDCWPITDYKRHSREYRAAAYRWLEQLKRDNYLLGPVVLRRSYFEDCRGEHMNTIMLAFSTHVLQRTIDREIAADSSLSSGMDEIPMRISHIPHVNSLEDASNSLQDLLGSYASTLTSQVSKMNKYHEQWDKSAKLIANNLKSQSDRDKSDDLEKDQDYSSVESTPLPQVDIQIIRDRLRNILDTLRAKNEDLADAVSSNPVIVTRTVG